MTILLADAKAHLNVTTDADDQLIMRLVAVAQEWLEAQLGYKLTDRFPPAGSPVASTVPAPLDHAALLMVAHYYENREASVVGVNAQPLPFGVSDIVNDFRDWSWSDA